MGRLTIFLLLLLGPALLGGLFSCNECSPVPYRYGVEDYRAYPRKINIQNYQHSLTDTLITDDTVGYQEFELVLIGREIPLAMHNYSLGGSTAWACSPAYIALDSIKRLTITSSQPYNTHLRIGRDLGSIVTIGEGSYNQKLLSDYLAVPFAQAQAFFSLRFTQAPDRTTRHQFRITVDSGRGRTNSFSIKPIFIKP